MSSTGKSDPLLGVRVERGLGAGEGNDVVVEEAPRVEMRVLHGELDGRVCKLRRIAAEGMCAWYDPQSL